MKRIVLTTVILSVLCGIKTEAQQIPIFSQYMFNDMYINPAQAGAKDAFFANVLYRKQWIGFKSSPQTAMFSVDGNLPQGSNFGLKYMNDQSGANYVNSVAIDYAYRFNISAKGRLSFGLSGGFVNYGINRAKLTEDNNFDTENKWKPNVDAGIYLDFDKFYAGASVLGIIQHKADPHSMHIMRAYSNFLLNVGGTIPLSEKVDFKPSVLCRTDFKNPVNLDINALLQVDKKFWIGGSYRTGVLWFSDLNKATTRQFDAISLIFETLVSDKIRIGASYDFDLTEIPNNSGSIEISLGFYITKPKRK